MPPESDAPPSHDTPAAPAAPIRHLFISPGHNFFGRHGQAADTHEIIEVDRMECVAGRGIVGDRFFDYKADYKGQITFFEWKTLQDIWAALGIEQHDPSAPRRNVIIENLDLNSLIGREFEIQGVRFIGVEESKPCYWMDQAIGPGAEAFLRGRGGLRAKIVTSGCLSRD